MADPQILSVGAGADASSTALSPAYPAIVAAGGFINAAFCDFGASSAPTPPEGWTLRKSLSFGSANQHRVFLFSKPSTGSETGTETFTFSASNRKAGIMFATDADIWDQVSAGGGALGAASIDHNQVTPVNPSSMVVYVFAATYGTEGIVLANMSPAGTLIGEASRNSTNSAYIGLGYEIQASASQTELRTSTNSGTATTLAQLTFVIAKTAASSGGVSPGSASSPITSAISDSISSSIS